MNEQEHPGSGPGSEPEAGQPPQSPQLPQPPLLPQQSAPGSDVPPQQPPHAPGQQYPYPAPTGAPAPRKGLPVGAWIGIGAAALVFMLLIAVVLAWFVLAWTLASDPVRPAPTTSPQVEPDAETDQGSSSDRVSLDDPSHFSAGPFWGVPVQSGWDIVRFDEQGVNEFTHATAGCQFLTYQGYGPESLVATDDRGATEETLSTAMRIGLSWDLVSTDLKPVEDGTQDLQVDRAYPVEMQRYIVKYESSVGERQRRMLLRVFMPSNIAMYAEVDCPASAAGDEVAEKALDGLSLTEF